MIWDSKSPIIPSSSLSNVEWINSSLEIASLNSLPIFFVTNWVIKIIG